MDSVVRMASERHRKRPSAKGETADDMQMRRRRGQLGGDDRVKPLSFAASLPKGAWPGQGRLIKRANYSIDGSAIASPNVAPAGRRQLICMHLICMRLIPRGSERANPARRSATSADVAIGDTRCTMKQNKKLGKTR